MTDLPMSINLEVTCTEIAQSVLFVAKSNLADRRATETVLFSDLSRILNALVRIGLTNSYRVDEAQNEFADADDDSTKCGRVTLLLFSAVHVSHILTCAKVTSTIEDNLAELQCVTNGEKPYIKLVNLEWQIMPERGFVSKLEITIDTGVLAGMVEQSAPAAAATEPLPPAPVAVSKLSRIVDGDAGDENASQVAPVRLKRDRLEQKSMQHVAESQERELLGIVESLITNAAEVSTSGASSSLRARIQREKSLPKLSIRANPLSAIQKKKAAEASKSVKTAASAFVSKAPEQASPGALGRFLKKLFGVVSTSDPYVERYAAHPEMFKRLNLPVQK